MSNQNLNFPEIKIELNQVQIGTFGAKCSNVVVTRKGFYFNYERVKQRPNHSVKSVKEYQLKISYKGIEAIRINNNYVENDVCYLFIDIRKEFAQNIDRAYQLDDATKRQATVRIKFQKRENESIFHGQFMNLAHDLLQYVDDAICECEYSTKRTHLRAQLAHEKYICCNEIVNCRSITFGYDRIYFDEQQQLVNLVQIYPQAILASDSERKVIIKLLDPEDQQHAIRINLRTNKDWKMLTYYLMDYGYSFEGGTLKMLSFPEAECDYYKAESAVLRAELAKLQLQTNSRRSSRVTFDHNC